MDHDDHKAPFHFDFSKHLSPQDADLVIHFLSSQFDGRLRVSSDTEGATAYGYLAALLGLLKQHTMLEIIDSKRSEFLELLRVVRVFSFEGNASWLDSLQQTVRGNSQVDASSLKALEIEDCALDLQINSQRLWYNEWGRMWLLGADHARFITNIQVLVDKLKSLRDRKKLVLEVRASLQFKHNF